MDKWTVKVSMSYESLYFTFETAEEADDFAKKAFHHIVREEDSRGELRDVTVTISSSITTKKEEEE